MRVLILTISTGQGHNQTSKALCEYLEGAGAECRVLDAYKYISPLLSESFEKGYLLTTQYTPAMYGGFYRLAEKKEKSNPRFSIAKVANSIIGPKIIKFVKGYSPDVIVATHIFTAGIITNLWHRLPPVKTFGIITDFTVHPFWEDTDLDFYVTASHLLNNQCTKKGIPLSHVLPFGIPIRERFAKKVEKSRAREMLSIKDKPTVMIMMGSMGYGNLAGIVRKIDGLSLDFQVLCVCGRSERAKRRVERLSTAHEVYTYGFVDNVDVMMDAADFIITKPGGLSVSEALAKGLPMILSHPIPGQEERNLEFLLNNGLAMAISPTFPVDEAVYQFYENKWRADNMKGGVSYIGKPHSARELGDFILGQGEK